MNKANTIKKIIKNLSNKKNNFIYKLNVKNIILYEFTIIKLFLTKSNLLPIIDNIYFIREITD